MNRNIAVVGAGQAAAELVRVLRQKGYAGEIRVFGNEAFPPYERPPLSKRFLNEGLDAERLFLRNRETYLNSGVDLLTGSVVSAVDPVAKTIQLANGKSFSFDVCVLATGADARRPNLAGNDLEGVHAFRTMDDARKLRSALKAQARLVIAGGGYLGLEVASSARAAGVAVTVVEGAKALMQRSISALTASAVERRHRAEGTRILFETTVSSVNGKTRVESVTTSSGEVIEADAVLFAIGADPVVGLARLAEVECDNGIVVDARCRTSIPDIYAIGDCANQLHLAYGRHLRLESVNSALFHARSAAADLLGQPLPAPKPPSFWSEQCGLTIQVLGVPSPGSPCEDVLRGDDTAFSVYRFQDGALVAVEAVNRPRDFIQAHAIVGQRNVTLPID